MGMEGCGSCVGGPWYELLMFVPSTYAVVGVGLVGCVD